MKKTHTSPRNLVKEILKSRILLGLLFLLSVLVPFIFADVNKATTIVLSDTGFSPSRITVPVGTTVTWKIEGKNARWPASDDHPSHEIYPEFDPQEVIQPGESWSFKFEKVGAWMFHDHTEPKFTGKVEVIAANTDSKYSSSFKELSELFTRTGAFLGQFGKNAPAFANAKELLNYCTSQNSQTDCFEDEFAQLSRKHDFPTVLKTFREVVALSNDPIGCHQIAHEVSRVYVEQDIDEWRTFLANAPDDCTYGFIHGAIEAYGRLSDANFRVTPEFIRDSCVGAFKGEKRQTAQCVHVFGHMLLVGDKGDVRKSLASCLKLGQDLYPDQCFHGAFMENITKINLAAEGLASINTNKPIHERFSEEEVKALCSEDSPFPDELCWREMSHVYTFISNFDPVFSFKACEENAPSESAGNSCIIHALINIFSQNQEDPLRTISSCSVYTTVPNFRERCFNILAQMATYSSSQNRIKVIEFCNRAPTDIKSSCFQTVGRTLNEVGLSSDQKKQICSKSDASYKDICINI